MSRSTFESLDPNDRDLLVATARESVPFMRQLWDRMDAESRDIVLKAGVQANEVDSAAFHEAAKPVLERYLQRQGLSQVYESIRAAA